MPCSQLSDAMLGSMINDLEDFVSTDSALGPWPQQVQRYERLAATGVGVQAEAVV
jgi:hypothetical protein